MNSRQKIADEWTTVDSSPNSFRQNFLLQQQPPQNSYSTSTQSSAPVLPLNTASYNYTSSFLHTLFDADSEPLLKNEATNYSSSSPNVRMNSAGAVPDFPGAAMKPSFPKQQIANNFQFINNANFWSATVAASCGEVRASFLPSSTPQLIPSALAKPKLNQKVHMQQILRFLSCLYIPRFSTVNLNNEERIISSKKKKRRNFMERLGKQTLQRKEVEMNRHRSVQGWKLHRHYQLLR